MTSTLKNHIARANEMCNPHVMISSDRRIQMVQVLDYSEAAKRAGIVRRTLERLIKKGEGPAIIQISIRRKGVLESDLEAWLNAKRHDSTGAITNHEV